MVLSELIYFFSPGNHRKSWFYDDFRGNKCILIHLKSLNMQSKTWSQSLTMFCFIYSNCSSLLFISIFAFESGLEKTLKIYFYFVNIFVFIQFLQRILSFKTYRNTHVNAFYKSRNYAWTLKRLGGHFDPHCSFTKIFFLEKG